MQQQHTKSTTNSCINFLASNFTKNLEIFSFLAKHTLKAYTFLVLVERELLVLRSVGGLGVTLKVKVDTFIALDNASWKSLWEIK